MLTECTSAIAKAYSRLDYSLGWRFLYSPARTMQCANGFLLLGTNPGGDRYQVSKTVESGNAFIVEDWGREGIGLQNQVRLLFDLLETQFQGRRGDGESLLSETMTSNFCPFRSPTWRQLPRQSEAIAFSASLWHAILTQVSPRVIICMGTIAYPFIRETLFLLANSKGRVTLLPTGWGDYAFSIHKFERAGSPIVLAHLPHLSRYKLMSRSQCLPYVKGFVERIHHAAT